MIKDLCAHLKLFLITFLLKFGFFYKAVDLSLFSSDSSLLRGGKLTGSISFRPDEVLARLNSGLDSILT